MKHVIAPADTFTIPVSFVSGQGSYLTSAGGKRYLDFLGGWCTATVGWGNREMAEAITTQANIGIYAPPVFHDPNQEALGQTLIEHAPGNLAQVFRCTSGSEAVEFGIKCARAATGKPTIVTIDGVYHGHTFGAASLGDACSKRMAPCLSGFVKLSMPRTAASARAIVEQFDKLTRERNDIAAFMSEPVWTNAGCIIPPPDFYPAIEAICRRRGILLVMDEVATGIGRCGQMYASALWNIRPDIICLGKSLTGGYATMGATLVTSSVYKKSKGIPAYSTFGWLAQDCAPTTKNVEIILRDRLDKNAAEVGAFLLDALKPLERLRKVQEVRGIGMVFAIEFTLPIALFMAALCLRRGLTVAYADKRTLFFSPPLSLTRDEALEGAAILARVCGA